MNWRALGRAEEHEYLNVAGQRARWLFRGLIDLDDPSDEVPRDGDDVVSGREAW